MNPNLIFAEFNANYDEYLVTFIDPETNCIEVYDVLVQEVIFTCNTLVEWQNWVTEFESDPRLLEIEEHMK